MKTYLTIGNVNFLSRKANITPVEFESICNGRTLYDCYRKPSNTKREIYAYWKRWADENGVTKLTVSSYNTNYFSLSATYRVDDKFYGLTITASNKFAYEID